jgi:serine/threonine protein kinase
VAPDQVYLITELLTGGELLDAVLRRGSYNEGDARACFVQLLRGIEYLHAKCARRTLHISPSFFLSGMLGKPLATPKLQMHVGPCCWVPA